VQVRVRKSVKGNPVFLVHILWLRIELRYARFYIIMADSLNDKYLGLLTVIGLDKVIVFNT
jgi:hypothetical protein